MLADRIIIQTKPSKLSRDFRETTSASSLREDWGCSFLTWSPSIVSRSGRWGWWIKNYKL